LPTPPADAFVASGTLSTFATGVTHGFFSAGSSFFFGVVFRSRSIHSLPDPKILHAKEQPDVKRPIDGVGEKRVERTGGDRL